MDIEWKRVGVVGVLALIPTFVAYMMASMAANTAVPSIFLVGILVFGYLINRGSTWKEQASNTLFWLAVEMLLAPLALLAFTITSGTGTLGGMIVVGGGFVVGLPLAGVFYLLSRRLG